MGGGQLLRWLALGGLLAPLAALAVVGVFTRYAADDYCTAGQVRMAGFISAQSELYTAWSGRFSATLLITLVELAGPPIVAVLPALALAAWLAALTWASIAWGVRTLSAVVLAALIVFSTLDTTADMPQVLYWQTGLLTYLAPLLLATVYVGWLARGQRFSWPIALGVSFVLCLIAGGTSETFAAAQVAALGLSGVSVGVAGAGHRKLFLMLLAGLGGALVALAIVALAPGNQVRQEGLGRSEFPRAIADAVDFTAGWLRLTFARPHAVVLGLLLLVPVLLAQRASRTTYRRALAALPLGLLVILASMVPAFYALSSNPPGRAQVIPQYVVVVLVAVVGWQLGLLASGRLGGLAAAAALAMLLVLGPLLTTAQLLLQLPTARAYAATWDARDLDVRGQRDRGVRDVTVEPLPSTGMVRNLEFVGPRRDDWFNQCVARFYGVGTIASQ